jgi:hypothetical protein
MITKNFTCSVHKQSTWRASRITSQLIFSTFHLMLAEIPHQNHHSAVHPHYTQVIRAVFSCAQYRCPYPQTFPRTIPLLQRKCLSYLLSCLSALCKMPHSQAPKVNHVCQTNPFPSRVPPRYIQPKCRRKNSVISSFSSMTNNNPLMLLPPARLWAKGYPVFSKHFSYCTPIRHLNDDNNPHPDSIVTAH